MEKFPVNRRTRITRLPKRGAYDRASVHAILDEALVCTLAFVRDGEPVQLPTGFCRVDDLLYVHGSVGSGWMRALADGSVPVCISATLIDGLVLARSAFHHSVNYRSVVLFGTARRVTDREELYRALEAFTEKMCPGRWLDIRLPTEREWKQMLVLAFGITEASAKVRSGPPIDDEEDYDLDVWAGVWPMKIAFGTPEPDPRLKPGVELPQYLSKR
jgi:hypothetical protein